MLVQLQLASLYVEKQQFDSEPLLTLWWTETDHTAEQTHFSYSIHSVFLLVTTQNSRLKVEVGTVDQKDSLVSMMAVETTGVPQRVLGLFSCVLHNRGFEQTPQRLHFPSTWLKFSSGCELKYYLAFPNTTPLYTWFYSFCSTVFPAIWSDPSAWDPRNSGTTFT